MLVFGIGARQQAVVNVLQRFWDTVAQHMEYHKHTRKAEASDELQDTVNYQKVYQYVKSEMQTRSKLLEHVARRILVRIKQEFPEVNYAKIKIRKLNPPLGGKMDFVAVELEL